MYLLWNRISADTNSITHWESGFEQPVATAENPVTTAEGWECQGRLTCSLDTVNFSTGQQSQKVSINPGSTNTTPNGIRYKLENLAPSRVYKLTAKIKVSRNSAMVKISDEAGDNLDVYNNRFNSWFTAEPSVFQEKEFFFKTTDSSPLYVVFGAFNQIGGADFYLDDVSVDLIDTNLSVYKSINKSSDESAAISWIRTGEKLRGVYFWQTTQISRLDDLDARGFNTYLVKDAAYNDQAILPFAAAAQARNKHLLAIQNIARNDTPDHIYPKAEFADGVGQVGVADPFSAELWNEISAKTFKYIEDDKSESMKIDGLILDVEIYQGTDSKGDGRNLYDGRDKNGGCCYNDYLISDFVDAKRGGAAELKSALLGAANNPTQDRRNLLIAKGMNYEYSDYLKERFKNKVKEFSQSIHSSSNNPDFLIGAMPYRHGNWFSDGLVEGAAEPRMPVLIFEEAPAYQNPDGLVEYYSREDLVSEETNAIWLQGISLAGLSKNPTSMITKDIANYDGWWFFTPQGLWNWNEYTQKWIDCVNANGKPACTSLVRTDLTVQNGTTQDQIWTKIKTANLGVNPGDLNCDNIVNESDLSVALTNWLRQVDTPCSVGATIDELSLSSIISNWNKRY